MNTGTFIYSDQVAIRQLLDDVVMSFNKMDLEKLLSYHTDNVVLMEPGMPVIEGKDEVRKLFAHFQEKGIEMELDFILHEIEVSGNLAYVRGQVIKTVIEQSVKLEPAFGKFICLLKKQRGGSWFRSHVIVNSDHA